MENKNRLDKLMRFILEIDKGKQVMRQTYLSDGSRKENDAEHSWHLALMAILLSEYANEPVDSLKVMKMVLIHDLVEIDAGDTYAYDKKGNETKGERELQAADRIFGLLPGDMSSEFRTLWEEFESGETMEAKFALTLDKIQPVLLNDASGGIAWKEHGIHVSQVFERNKDTHQGSEVLWEYAKGIIEKNVGKNNLRNEKI